MTRVADGTAYVQITGAEITDTPVAMSIDAKPGDKVRLRVSNGRAWLTGNDTRPPTNEQEQLQKAIDAGDENSRRLDENSRRLDEIVTKQNEILRGIKWAMSAVSKSPSFGATIWTFNVYKFAECVVVYYNIQVPALTAATEYTMCNISGKFDPAEKMNFTVAGQIPGHNFLLQVYATGNVTIYSVSNVSAGDFVRGTLVIPIRKS